MRRLGYGGRGTRSWAGLLLIGAGLAVAVSPWAR